MQSKKQSNTLTSPQTRHVPDRFDPRATLAELLQTLCVSGMYGQGTLTITVQDGVVQHLRVGWERMLK